MGRGVACLVLCTLATGLPGCGEAAADADFPTFLEAEAEVRSLQRAAPTLVGRARRFSPTAARDEIDEGPSAEVDENATITIPAGATWETVQRALHVSAGRRRAREDLEGTPPMLVDLPGVSGYVIVDGSPKHGATGLYLTLWSSGGLKAEAFGNAWIAHYGCEARTTWKALTLSRSTWREALARLAEVPAVGPVIRIRADASLQASKVVPFIAAATATGADVHVHTGYRRKFDDAVGESSSWLSAHQSPNGCWDESVAEGLCDGHRMRDVPISGDPEKIGNAGVTGLSLLAFLGAGYTNRGKHPFNRTVGRGLRHLKNLQRPNGAFTAREGWDEAVAHGFAALAMLEAYGMTGSPIFKGSAQRSLDALAPLWSASDNALATALFAAVLKSAEIINADAHRRGKPLPLEVNESLRERLVRYARRFDVGAAGDLEAGCWLLTRVFLDNDTPKEDDALAGAMALAKAVEKTGAQTDPAHLWVATVVCFQLGGKRWDRMKRVLEKHVIENQRMDGHACCQKGSWDPPATLSVPGDRVASTALSVMCLEFFYRYDKVFGSR